MDKKIKLGVVVLLVIAIGVLVFFLLNSDSDKSDDESDSGIAVIEHNQIYDFDANLDRNAEAYPDTVRIENLEVLYTMHEKGAPVIYSTYILEEGERHWFIEYEGEDADLIEEGHMINVVGKFSDQFKTYEDFVVEDEETMSDVWTVGFIADEVEIIAE